MKTNFMYKVGWILSRLVFKLFFRLKIEGADHVPVSGPVILAANHASFLDPVLVGCSIQREIYFMARKTLMNNRFTKWLFNNLNTVPIDRDGTGVAGFKTILNLLQAGHGVVLFPEGTRSRDGSLQPAKPGIGMLALKSNAPVVPVLISGSFEALSRDRIVPKFTKICVRFGKPIDFKQYLCGLSNIVESSSDKKLCAILASKIMEEIAALNTKAHGPQINPNP